MAKTSGKQRLTKIRNLLKILVSRNFFGWERISRFSTLWVNTKSNKNFVGWVRFITMHIGANLPTFPVNKFFPYYLCPRKWHVLLLFLATKRRVNRLFLPILSPLIFLKIPYFQPSRRHYKHDIKGLLLQDSFQRPLPQTTGCPKLIGHSVKIRQNAITQILCEIKFQKCHFYRLWSLIWDNFAPKMCKKQPNWFHVKSEC